MKIQLVHWLLLALSLGPSSLEYLYLVHFLLGIKPVLLDVTGFFPWWLIDSFVVDCRTDDIDPLTKGMLMMWGVFAEMERDIISSRVKSGMENAKAKGKHIGRPKTDIDNIPSSFWKYYPKYKNKEINVTEFSKLAELSRKSIYKYIKYVERP